MIGRTLGQSRIIEQIGVGGMANVYKAYDPLTDRYVAIKVLPSHFSQDPTFRERFHREAKAIAKLEHIHILPIFSYGEEDGIAYMAMRYLETGTLTDLIRQGPLSFSEASRLLNQIAVALDYAHANNVLHRDVKPSNVLLDAQRNAFLTDFGIAKMVESTLDLTGAGILGTPAYMSPEQCRGSKELMPATDQYSLGIVLYEMITGVAPFQAETPIALIHMQLNDPLPLPRQLQTNLPEEAERAILKALAKEPDARYPTCRDFAAAFEQAIQSQPDASNVVATVVPSPADTVTETMDEPTLLHQPASKPGRARWIWGAIAAAMVMILLLLGFGLAAFFMLEESASPAPAEDATQTDSSDGGQPQPADPDAVLSHAPAGVADADALERAYQFWPNLIAEPCNWSGSGSGLCLSSWAAETEPIRILADLELEIIDDPSFSPTGERLVFSAAPGDSEDIYAIANIFITNTDGSNLIEFPLPGGQTSPAWRADGEWLTFTHDGHLAIMRPNGDDFRIILKAKERQCIARPQWSPDGDSIAVSVDEHCDDRLPITRNILLVNDQGNSVKPLATTVYNTRDCVDFALAFSPNGRQVAYLDQHCQAHLVRTNGSAEPLPIEEFPWNWRAHHFPLWQEFRFVDQCVHLDAGGPGECIHTGNRMLGRILTDISFDQDRGGGPFSWSPDGKRLVFSRAEPDAPFNSIYTVREDNTGLNQLSLPEDAVEPVWSPDGDWLAFIVAGAPAIARPDGSEFTILQEDLTCIYRLGWSPDSEWLVASIILDSSTCEYAFPQKRGIWMISRSTGEIIPLIEVTHPRECDEWVPRVAFNRTGEYVAFIDGDCRSVAFSVANPDERIDLTEFPWWWENYTFPQWGGLPR
jgi:serine/threonine protein kinase